MTLSAIELQSRLAAIIMRGLTAGLYANITDAMLTTLATSAASAVSAILAVVPGGAPSALEFRAELAATIFSALATGTSTINDGVLTSITGSQITGPRQHVGQLRGRCSVGRQCQPHRLESTGRDASVADGGAVLRGPGIGATEYHRLADHRDCDPCCICGGRNSDGGMRKRSAGWARRCAQKWLRFYRRHPEAARISARERREAFSK